MDLILVYITTESRGQAEDIGRALLEKRLVACVNIIEKIHSMYWWQGRIETSDETLLLAKTRQDNFDRVSELVKELHSYQTPCIVAVPLADGQADFMDWIRAETI